MMSSHWGQHDEDCYGCKLRTIRLSAGLHPISRKDRQWDKDMEAYARLRHDGVQPRQIDGSAELESKARDKVEIDYGLASTERGLKQAQQLVADMGQ
jgi:hypothetical protein